MSTRIPPEGAGMRSGNCARSSEIPGRSQASAARKRERKGRSRRGEGLIPPSGDGFGKAGEEVRLDAGEDLMGRGEYPSEPGEGALARGEVPQIGDEFGGE